MRQRTLIDLLLVASLILVMGIIYYATIRPGQDWGGDFSQYINHSRNLALHRPYLETRYVVAFPESARRMPPAYPPVFPLVLAPVYRRFGLDYEALKFPVQALFVLSAVVYYALARLRGLDPLPATAAVTGFALSGLLLSIKDSIISESTYLVLAGLTLLALVLVERNKWSETRPAAAAFGVAGLMLLSYGTRAIGLSLIVGFVLYEILVERRIRLFSVLVVCAFSLGVAAISLTLYSSRSYQGEFQFAPAVYLQNIASFVKSPGSLWCDPTPRYVRWPLFTTTVVIALSAWFRRILTRPSVIEFYVIASIVPVILHATGFLDRYLLPVYAIYFIYFMEGVLWLQRRYTPSLSWASASACLVLVLGAAVNVWAMEKGPYRQGVEQATFRQTCQYIRTSIDANAMVVSWNPRVLALYTDRLSAWYPYTNKDEEFNEYLSRVHADYLLFYVRGDRDNLWLAPHLRNELERFELVFSNADFRLYRIRNYRPPG